MQTVKPIFICFSDLQFLFTSYTSFLKYATSAGNGSCLYCLKYVEATETHLMKRHYLKAVHFILDGTGMFIKEHLNNQELWCLFWSVTWVINLIFSESFVVPCVCKARIQVNGRSHWHCPLCRKIIFRTTNFEQHLSKQHGMYFFFFNLSWLFCDVAIALLTEVCLGNWHLFVPSHCAAKMLFGLAEKINKNIFLSFNLIDILILQGYQGTGMSTVCLHSSSKTINLAVFLELCCDQYQRNCVQSCLAMQLSFTRQPISDSFCRFKCHFTCTVIPGWSTNTIAVDKVYKQNSVTVILMMPYASGSHK